MIERKNIRCEIYCQKGKQIEAELSADQGIYETEGVHIEVLEEVRNGCRYGGIRIKMKNESCWENQNLRMKKPIRVYLLMAECPEKITTMYLYNEWWTRPVFVESFQEIPESTQVAFLQYHDRFACLAPMAGNKFKTCLAKGMETEICLEMAYGLGGLKTDNEPLYVFAEAPVLAEAVYKVFSWLAEYKGIRMREKRRIPEMFRYLVQLGCVLYRYK